VERAQLLFEETYRVRAEMGDLARMALSLVCLAETAIELGDKARARELATRSLELAREVGDHRITCTAGQLLAWIALDEGRMEDARNLFAEALALAHEIASPWNTRNAIEGFAAVAAATRDGPLAARLAAAAGRAVPVYFHAFVTPALGALLERHLAAVRATTDPVEWAEAWRRGATLSLEQTIAEIDKAAVASDAP